MRPDRVAINKEVIPKVHKKQILEHNIQPQNVNTKSSSGGTTTYKVKTNGGNLHVRSKPSTSGTILTKMPNGTKFEVTEVQSGWGKHTYNGKTGWSSLQYAVKESTSSSSSSSNSSKETKYFSESILEGTIKLKEPNLNIKAKKGVTLQGLGSKLSGLYFVESVEHTFDSSGYTQQITVSRSWKGESMKNTPVSTTSTPSTPPKTDKPVVTPTVQTRTYTIKKGDTLWAIAKKYYGKGSDYTKIFNANKDKIKDPNKIYPGQVITIP